MFKYLPRRSISNCLSANRRVALRPIASCTIGTKRATSAASSCHQKTTCNLTSTNGLITHENKQHFQSRRFLSTKVNATNDLPRSLGDDDPTIDLTKIKGEFGSYIVEYERAKKDPSSFWAEAAKDLVWFEEPSVSLQQCNDNSNTYEWFPDGKINTCYNCLDVQIDKYGRGDQTALIYDSPLTNVQEKYTYRELLNEVSKFAGALQNDLGVQVGDRVVIYMPMIPQAMIAMLACARIGAVHSVVFGGFASQELASRITDCQPKVSVAIKLLIVLTTFYVDVEFIHL